MVSNRLLDYCKQMSQTSDQTANRLRKLPGGAGGLSELAIGELTSQRPRKATRQLTQPVRH
jgi:hypothetical protein